MTSIGAYQNHVMRSFEPPLNGAAQTRLRRRTRDPMGNLLPYCPTALLPPRHEGEALEQMHVLLVLQERAVQPGQRVFRIAAQVGRLDVVGDQQPDPVE